MDLDEPEFHFGEDVLVPDLAGWRREYPSPEAQDENLEMLIGWVREYATRQDEFSLRSHRRLFDGFQGDKVEFSSTPPTNDSSH